MAQARPLTIGEMIIYPIAKLRKLGSDAEETARTNHRYQRGQREESAPRDARLAILDSKH